jgi:dihydroorotate dehydrogenase (NAD+) catalytic subunit
VISVAGCTREELVRCVTVLARSEEVKAIEVNLSCPNIAHGGTKYALFSQDPQITEEVIKCIRKETDATLIAKLTPNVTDIAVIARAAENGGADAVSLVNTYLAMAVDAEEMKPLLGNVTGGLSGPAIKPMALRAVWETHKAVSIPVIGIGGIMTGIDVAEFMLCGASAVQVGTANFVDPASPARVLKEFKEYLRRKKIGGLGQIVGKLRT